jgi:hypothetical protein
MPLAGRCDVNIQRLLGLVSVVWAVAGVVAGMSLREARGHHP